VAATQLFPESQPVVPETKAPRQSYPFYKVWWTALTKPDVRSYADLLDDPEAGVGRAVEWQVYTNLSLLLLGGLVGFVQLQSMFALPEFQKLQSEAPLFNNTSSNMALIIFLLIFILVGVIFGVLGLLLNGAIQNLLARMFGGTGNFSRTVYALSAYLIPISIIVTVISYIPLVNCLTLAVSSYCLVLNVRALQAAHGLNGGRATIIVAIPTLILLMIVCVSFIFISSWMGTALQNYKYQPLP
jgi:hypothetical protein